MTKCNVDYSLIFKHYSEIRKNTILFYPDSSSIDIFENKLKKYCPKGNQVYDLEIVSIMLANNINHIASFNEKDFREINEVEIFKL